MVGGELVTALAEATGAQLIPVDSEHSALHQLIAGERAGTVDRLTVTASGRPVPRPLARRDGGGHRRAGAQAPDVGDGRQDHDRLGDADEQGARGDRGPPPVRHALRPDRRRGAPAVDRPRDGRACATARRSRTSAIPDMRVPIAYALHHPERVDVPVPTLDLAQVGSLTFEPPDVDAFPCLRLSREAAEAGGTAPCVLNAANEVAVHAFLNGRLPFMGIPAVIEQTLERVGATARARVRVALRGRRRGARRGRRADRGPGRMSFDPRVPGLRGPDHPARGGPLRGRQGGRHARRALRAVLPAADRAQAARRDRVRDRGDPARRLREDHRDEPGGGDPSGGTPTAPTTASRCGSASWSSRAGPAVNIVLAFLILAGIYWANGTTEPPPRVADIKAGSPAAGILKSGDVLVSVDGKRPPADGTLREQNQADLRPDRHAPVRRQRPGVQGDRAGHARRPPRRAS